MALPAAPTGRGGDDGSGEYGWRRRRLPAREECRWRHNSVGGGRRRLRYPPGCLEQEGGLAGVLGVSPGDWRGGRRFRPGSAGVEQARRAAACARAHLGDAGAEVGEEAARRGGASEARSRPSAILGDLHRGKNFLPVPDNSKDEQGHPLSPSSSPPRTQEHSERGGDSRTGGIDVVFGRDSAAVAGEEGADGGCAGGVRRRRWRTWDEMVASDSIHYFIRHMCRRPGLVSLLCRVIGVFLCCASVSRRGVSRVGGARGGDGAAHLAAAALHAGVVASGAPKVVRCSRSRPTPAAAIPYFSAPSPARKVTVAVEQRGKDGNGFSDCTAASNI
uniref:Uncharacterized protein n=1 Tax=Oryza rufipogon TaxID=4529 RepID=A0A0E0QNY1_ORYRU